MDIKKLLLTINKMDQCIFDDARPISKKETIKRCCPTIFVLRETGSRWKYIADQFGFLSATTLRMYYFEELKRVENDPVFIAQVDKIRRQYEADLSKKRLLIDTFLSNDDAGDNTFTEREISEKSEDREGHLLAGHGLSVDESERILLANYKPKEEQKSIEELLSAPPDPELMERVKKSQLEKQLKEKEKWNKVIR